MKAGASPVGAGASVWPRERSGQAQGSGYEGGAAVEQSRNGVANSNASAVVRSNVGSTVNSTVGSTVSSSLSSTASLGASSTTSSTVSRRDALQALLAFAALHQQIRQRRVLAAQALGFDAGEAGEEFESGEQFVLDDVLQLVAERAIAITGADGLGIALAENNEIVLRAAAGAIRPDVGARIQRDSAFSGACFRNAQVIRCNDTESDERVNLYACRQLGVRSMVAVPLCGRRRVIGLLEAFSAEPYGFNDTDVVSLELLAELILAALKPEDEDRFALSAQVAEAELGAPMQTAAEFPSGLAEISLVEARGQEEAESAAATFTASELTAGEFTLQERAGVVVEEYAPGLQLLKPHLPESGEEDLAEEGSTAERFSEEPVSAESVSEEHFAGDQTQPAAVAAGHHGILVALVLVVVAVLVAGGIWWKLKNAQLGAMVVRTEPKVIRPSKPTESDSTGAANSEAPSASVGSLAGDSSGAGVPVALNAAGPTMPAVGTSSAGMNGQVNSAANSGTAGIQPDSGTDGANAPEAAKPARVIGIRHWASTDSSTVVIDLEDQVQYEAHRLSGPDRIYFDLHDTSLAAELAGKTIDVGDAMLARIRVSQMGSNLTRVVLEPRGNANFSVSLESNPYRLVVQLRKLGAKADGEINLFPGVAQERAAQEKMAIVVPPPTAEDVQMRARVPKMRVVVDAGHGGWDLGTVGKRGLLEKDVVLEIAQRLGKLLESRLGAEVILTRKDDNYIPLDERAEMANQSQADLFVSVHANYSDLPSARGVETYYTNFFSAVNGKDGEGRDLGRDRGASAPGLSEAELHDKIEQSRRLAASVQRSLYGTLSAQNPGLRDRGVKEASYVVLTETTMPGILAEVSFVSSPTDEQKLRSDGYREQIAEALYRGVARYAVNSRGIKMASAVK